ncbi:hypothetical protein L6452_40432 [Arctium lappa]|uniref:Uncharacterized protein n=1 Tax=Arctium lappa TaxID=4217 RepID=A0ACB8XMG0_ARCLA|nr:hypothetical protein L6452_40432 [Arctium lappa]
MASPWLLRFEIKSTKSGPNSEDSSTPTQFTRATQLAGNPRFLRETLIPKFKRLHSHFPRLYNQLKQPSSCSVLNPFLPRIPSHLL